MKGLKLWVMSLIEYDEYGNGVVIASFAKPAKDSAIKQRAKKKPVRGKTKVMSGEEELWK